MALNTPFGRSDDSPQIFQDFDTFSSDGFDIHQTNPMTSHAPMPNVTRPPRRALGDMDSNTILKPQQATRQAVSPHKMGLQGRSPLKPKGLKKLNKVAMPPPSRRPSTDNIHKKPVMSNFKTGHHRQSSLPTSQQWGNDNAHFQVFDPSSSLGDITPNVNGKRVLMEAAPITQDTRSAKRAKKEHNESSDAMEPPMQYELPAPDSFPPIYDDGKKPALSYAQLIGTAILRSPRRKLTLNQIYNWISQTFSFYDINQNGWQNSIRHNLSLHKSFAKVERPKDDPGKGHYWTIVAGCEGEFLKRRPVRKSLQSAENVPVMSTSMEPSRPATAPAAEPTLPQPAPIAQAPVPRPQELKMPSSDATIPEIPSDATEEVVDKQAETEAEPEPVFNTTLYSPAPAAMNSSPPVPRFHQMPSGTPQVSRFSIPQSSHVKQEANCPNDSGYISSLDSSALRPNKREAQWSSGGSKPRKKRGVGGSGRAEDAIRRIRNANSSPHSPTKSRSRSMNSLVPSSPVKAMRKGNPLTPAPKLRPPMQPPPSISPRVNLELHRKQMAALTSPGRQANSLAEVIPFSPNFNLEEETLYMNEFCYDSNTNNDMFSLDNIPWELQIGMLQNDSPLKKSIQRSASTGNLPMSAKAKKAITSAPSLGLPNQSPLDLFDTPSKAFGSSPFKFLERQAALPQPSPSKFVSQKYLDTAYDDKENEGWEVNGDEHQQPIHNPFAQAFPSDDTESDFDITQGFAQIG